MNWKEQLDKAVAAVKEAATSENAREIAGKAKTAAIGLVEKVKTGALDAADAFVEANRDASSLSVRFLNADLTILSPAEGISVTRPDAATLVVDDGSGNSLVINAGAKPAYVAETIGSVAKLSHNTFDLGQEDGVNVVVIKL
jgi:C4-type Zn-finger protein